MSLMKTSIDSIAFIHLVFNLEFGILAFIFAIIAPLYFMLGFNSLIEESYNVYASTSGTTPDIDYGLWFSISEGGFEANAGPGIAWYVMFIAGIIALIASILILKKDKETILPQPQE